VELVPQRLRLVADCGSVLGRVARAVAREPSLEDALGCAAAGWVEVEKARKEQEISFDRPKGCLARVLSYPFRPKGGYAHGRNGYRLAGPAVRFDEAD